MRFSTAPTGIRRGLAESGFLVNGEPRVVAQLRGKIERLDGFTVDEFVRRPSVGRFNPTTFNTVGLVTMRDPDSKEPFIAGAVLRIGTSRSWPVDSFTRSGLFACGAVAGCNIDVYEPELARAIEAEAIRIFGSTVLRRVGQPPKRLGVYKAAGEPITKE